MNKIKSLNTKRLECVGLSPDEMQLVDEMFEADTRIQVARGTQAKRISLVHARVRDMLAYTGRPIWEWNEDDFVNWAYHVVIESQKRGKKIQPGTQRTYQGAIRSFISNMLTSHTIMTKISTQYGVRLRQICSEQNMMVHGCDNNQAGIRLPYSQTEIDKMFAENKYQIELAYKFAGSKKVCLERDRVILAILYTTGVRADELLHIDIDHFLPDRRRPEFGKYARLTVRGKGTKGSGPRVRTFDMRSEGTARLIEYYVEHIRPHFLGKAGADEKALFLSERGKRLSYPAVNLRVNKLIEDAGIDRNGRSLHSFRHTYITLLAMMGESLVRIQRDVGHMHLSTTQGYIHTDAVFMLDEMGRASKNLLRI